MLSSTATYKILEDLIQFPSVTPIDAGSLNYIQSFIEDLGGSWQRIDHGHTSNLIATIGKGRTIFAFAGHVDVVPPGESSLWFNQQPFKLYNDGNGNLSGRGVVDMKGAIAAFLIALKDFVHAKPNLDHYQIKLLITSDEEGSAIDGTPKIVEQLKQQNLRLNYCLIGEPSSALHLGDTLKIGRRGSLNGKLTVYGNQGHIAYPHLAANAIHLALPALTELSQLQWDQGNANFPPTSFQWANLNAGLGVSNVIPGQLDASFNLRYNNLHQADELMKTIATILNRYDLKYALSFQHSAQPFLTTIGSLVRIAKAAITEVCSVNAELKTDGGTSDGRFLIEVSDELVELGLLNATAHHINETTTMDDINNLTLIYNKILHKIFNNG